MEVDLFNSDADQACWSFRLTLPAPTVQLDRDGNLIEDPASLEALKRIGDALEKLLGGRGELGDILASEGRYMLVVRIRLRTLLPGETPQGFVAGIMARIQAGNAALEQNLGANPRSPQELGVDVDQLRLMHTLRRAPISPEEPLIVEDAHGEQVASLAAPSEEAVANIPARPPRMQAVDGPVTGAGIGDERGAHVEINRLLTVVVPGASLDEVIGHLLAHRRVRGTIVREASPIFARVEWGDLLDEEG